MTQMTFCYNRARAVSLRCLCEKRFIVARIPMANSCNSKHTEVIHNDITCFRDKNVPNQREKISITEIK